MPGKACSLFGHLCVTDGFEAILHGGLLDTTTFETTSVFTLVARVSFRHIDGLTYSFLTV